MERDRGAPPERYTCIAPEALVEVSPEERRLIYRMLNLWVAVNMDGVVEVGGTLVKGEEFCPLEVQYWRP